MDTNANADQRDGGASAEGSAPSHRAAVRPKFPLQGLVRLVLTELGADDWEMAEGDFWCQVTPPAAPTRVQGWKLHLSATPLSAPEVLHRAAHVLVSGRCQFKFAARAERVSTPWPKHGPKRRPTAPPRPVTPRAGRRPCHARCAMPARTTRATRAAFEETPSLR